MGKLLYVIFDPFTAELKLGGYSGNKKSAQVV